MEVTNNFPVFRSFHQRDISRDFQDIQVSKEIPNSNLNSKCAFLFKNQSYVEKDALYAVKLDPAVLEAQVTLRAPPESREEIDNTITSATSNDENETYSDTASSIQLNDEFKTMLSMQRAALQSLSAQQFDLLLRYVDTLRKQRLSVQKQMECAFCKNNGHPMKWYSTHSLKDSKGRVRCPILRGYYCRRCGATGDHAHTIKYCTRSDLRS